MSRGRLSAAIVLVPGALLALGLAAFALRGLPPPTPNPPGTFAFAVLGDAPYEPLERVRHRLVLRDIEAHDLAFVVHVGDIFWRPCTDERYRRALGWYERLRHPVVYTPGDNEWADCWERGSGGFAPLDRLGAIRRIFYARPDRSLGEKRLEVVSQSGSPPFEEFVENARWTHEGIVFATVHVIGSRNGFRDFPGRTDADDAHAKRRTEAGAAWTRAAFEEAARTGASAVVLAFHADPGFGLTPSDPHRRDYEPFLTTLEEEAARFPGPVLVMHGDNHTYTVDHPLAASAPASSRARFTRLEVPGSPDVGWVRVVVTPGPAPAFAFEQRLVPRWKYW